MRGIETILNSSLKKKSYLKYDIYSGPLHIISLLPKGMNKVNSDLWTKNKKRTLKKYMLSNHY